MALAEIEPRPLKIDLADGPCPHCAQHGRQDESGAHLCDRCSAAIPVYCEMFGNGYQSRRPHHFHMTTLDGKAHWEPHNQELCRDCYRADFAAVHPDLEVPV